MHFTLGCFLNKGPTNGSSSMIYWLYDTQLQTGKLNILPILVFILKVSLFNLVLGSCTAIVATPTS